MKILVTGSEGNLGKYLVEALREKYAKDAIIRVALGSEEKFIPEENFYLGDLTDPAFVKRIFSEQKIDYVVHLAARLYGVAGFNADVFGLFNNDIKALLNALENAKDVKRFIYASSSMVYESSEDVPFTEEMTEKIMPPKSSYGLTKFIGEKAVIFFNRQFNIPYTIWRPFNIVSPLEDHHREGGHVFVDFYRKIFEERQLDIEIYGSGGQVRCFTWVEDVSNAMAEFMEDDRTKNEVFNIGSTEPKTMIDLKNVLVEIGKEKGVLPKDYTPGTKTGGTSFIVDVKLRIPSVEKIQSKLHWNHRTDFKETFNKFVLFKLHHEGKQV
jgi:UDP-glucose 4-epimerase